MVIDTEAPEEAQGQHQKVSLLDKVQHHTGFAITKIPGGHGRIVICPGGRTSSLYQGRPRAYRKSARAEDETLSGIREEVTCEPARKRSPLT
jgi:hypothetical protein